MKIYLVTDMEGVAGVLDHDNWVMTQGCWYKEGVELLTQETNAAIQGLLDGGATEIVLNDGHGAGGLNPLRLHPSPAVQLIRHAPDPVYPWGLDASYHGIAWVGQHAKAGTPLSHITHTGWFDVIDMTVNGVSIGEYGEFALCGQALGIPCIFAAGEQALCEEAQALTPGVHTVPVKWGLKPDGLDDLDQRQYRAAKLAARHLNPLEARRRIQAGARAAAEALRDQPEQFHATRFTAPYHKTMAKRRDGDTPIRHFTGTHPTSLIGLLNAPWDEIRPEADH